MQAVLQQLAKLDLSPLVPKQYRARAKAIGAGILGAIAIAVQLAFVDASTGADITTVATAVLVVLGVFQTPNKRKRA